MGGADDVPVSSSRRSRPDAVSIRATFPVAGR
jgi:hypothetical protein